MEITLNKLAFICLYTSWWNIYPPQDIAKKIWKEIVYNNWENYIKNDYLNHKKIWLYLHTPFCEAKCVFCSCWSEKVLWWNTLNDYLDKTINEIKYFSSIFKGIRLNHAYFGWWTPSIYNNEQLEYLLSKIRELYIFEDNAQWNFEISSHTITEKKIKILKKYWVSRITIWIQTMTEKSLKFNNRFQTWDKIEKTFMWIRNNKIENINVDLMPWIPWENLKDFLLNLKRIISLKPNMIHLYPFRPTEETLFFKNWFQYTSNDIKNRDIMYELGVKLIERNWYTWIENDSWWLNKSAINEQEVDKIVNNCSILGFWYPTRSYIHKNLMYFTWYDMYKTENSIYMWIKLTSKDYISRFLISHFRNGFDIIELNNKFWINFLDLYKNEIEFLTINKIAYIENNFFKTNISNVFEKLLFSKIFYSNENINLILDKFWYSENINYIQKFKDTLSVVYK